MTAETNGRAARIHTKKDQLRKWIPRDGDHALTQITVGVWTCADGSVNVPHMAIYKTSKIDASHLEDLPPEMTVDWSDSGASHASHAPNRPPLRRQPRLSLT